MRPFNEKRWHRVGVAVSSGAIVLALAGCAAPAPRKPAPDTGNPFSIVNVQQARAAEEAVEEKENDAVQRGRTLLEQRGTSQFVTAPSAVRPAQSGGVDVNFDKAPLAEVLKSILGDLLKVPYTIEGDIQGVVTLVSDRPIPQDSLIELLESLLEAQGVAMLRSEDGIYRIGSSKDLKRDVPVRQRDLSSQPGYSVRVLPLRYISVEEAVKILEPLGMAESVLRADPVRNILMLGAAGPQMKNAIRTLEIFDVDVMAGMSFGIYETVNIDAEIIVDRFNSLTGETELNPLRGLVKLVPIKEINGVMVITPRANYLDTARSWLERLDSVGFGDEAAGSQLYIYNVQNGEAENIASLLSQLYGTGGTTSRPATTSGATPPGMTQNRVGDGSNTNRTSSTTSANTGSGSSVTTEAGARIVADAINNSLLVMASPKEWRTIRSALERLDAVPSQVLVEVSIWEVTLRDELQYGVEWFFDSTPGSATARATLDLGTAGVSATQPGFSYLFNGNDWRAVINMLSSKSKVKALSSPSVLVLDNRTATIAVGNQQPVLSGQTVNTGNENLITQNIEFKDTGVQLKVTPRVNAGGLVIMEIAQEVTDIGQIDEATGQRSFLRRNIESTVAIQGGDTIVLGGLIQENSSLGDAGIPFLHKLPLVGSLFGSSSDETNRTELLVTISPRAVNQYRDFERIGEEFRRKMRGVTSAFSSEREHADTAAAE